MAVKYSFSCCRACMYLFKFFSHFFIYITIYNTNMVPFLDGVWLLNSSRYFLWIAVQAAWLSCALCSFILDETVTLTSSSSSYCQNKIILSIKYFNYQILCWCSFFISAIEVFITHVFVALLYKLYFSVHERAAHRVHHLFVHLPLELFKFLVLLGVLMILEVTGFVVVVCLILSQDSV